MTIMPFEGINYPTIEDEYGWGVECEPTHTDEDEAYYTDEILAGWHDESDADREGEYFTDESFDEWDSIHAGDMWERAFWGD